MTTYEELASDSDPEDGGRILRDSVVLQSGRTNLLIINNHRKTTQVPCY